MMAAASRSSILQAFVAGLQIDRADWDAGFADGRQGNAWRPGDRDGFSYASGFVEGRRFGPKKQGG